MTPNKAIEILKLHNEWRTDTNIESNLQMADPKDLTLAIDIIIKDHNSLLEIKTKFEEELNAFRLKIQKEKSEVDKLDPIYSNDEVLYECGIQLMAMENLYNKLFKSV